MLNLPISRDGFLWAFSITSQINRIPLATNLILQKYQPPYTLGSFRAAVEQGGMKIRQKAVPNSQLSKLPLPCLVTLIPQVEAAPIAVNGDQGVAQAAVREYQIALLENLDEKWVVLAEACSKAAITLSREAFEKRFAGEALIISQPTAAGSDAAQGSNISRNPKVNSGRGKANTSWFNSQPGWLRGMFRSAR